MAEEKEVAQKSGSFKKYLYIALVIIVLALIAFGIFQFIRIRNMYNQARDFAAKEAQFNQITESITVQYKTCQGLISQQQGDFANFEYCKQFINWANTLPLMITN